MALKIKAVGITEETPILVFQFPFELYPVSILYNSSSIPARLYALHSERARHTQSLFLIEAAIGKMIGEREQKSGLKGRLKCVSLSFETRRDERVFQESLADS